MPKSDSTELPQFGEVIAEVDNRGCETDSEVCRCKGNSLEGLSNWDCSLIVVKTRLLWSIKEKW